jgi:16S rRNA (cytosine967-C5)-methyltransferase
VGEKSRGAPPSRAAALAVLTRTLDGGQDLQAALNEELTARKLTRRDSGLATELAYGYLRQAVRIDFILNRFLKRPEGLKPKVRRTLGVAAYELLFLDRVPGYASVDWAVTQTRHLAGGGQAKAANAVLRRVAELGGEAEDPDFYRGRMTSETRFLSHFCSCPEWIVDLWLKAYGGEKTRSLLAAQIQAPPVGLRFNRTGPKAEALYLELAASRQTVVLETGLALPPGGPDLGEAMAEGMVSRQSAAAQQAMLELGCDDWPEPIWDACAGRGGKAFLLAELGKDVYASDPHTGRLAGLKEDGNRLGLTVPAFAARAEQTPPLGRSPGTMLLDVPCSGLGVLSRRPDLKYKRRPENLPGLIELQTKMLANAVRTVRPGGLAVYLTCTINPDENERKIETLLSEKPELSLETLWSTPADSQLNEFFFGAALRKMRPRPD